TGHLGFLKAVGVARFRKIEIKELKPAAASQGKERSISVPASERPKAEERKTPSDESQVDAKIAQSLIFFQLCRRQYAVRTSGCQTLQTSLMVGAQRCFRNPD